MLTRRDRFAVLGFWAIGAALAVAEDVRQQEAEMLAELRKEVAGDNLKEPDAYVPRLRLEVNQMIGKYRVSSAFFYNHASSHSVEYSVQVPGHEKPATVAVRVLRTRREAMDCFLLFGVDREIAVLRHRVKLPGLNQGDMALRVEWSFSVSVRNVNLDITSPTMSAADVSDLVNVMIAHVEREAATNGVKVVPFPKLDVDIGVRNDGKARQLHVRIGVPKGVGYEAMVGVGLEKSGYSYPQLVNGECVVDAREDERIEVMADVLTRDGYFIRRCRNFPPKAEEKKAP